MSFLVLTLFLLFCVGACTSNSKAKEQIIDSVKTEIPQEKEPKKVKKPVVVKPVKGSLVMTFTGDNLFGGRMAGYIKTNGYGFPYEFVKDTLVNSDITFGNLECPLTNYSHQTQGKSATSIRARKNFVFKAPPEYVKILVDNGFDIVTLGNNHAMDYRSEGLIETIDMLDKNGIAYIGGGKNLKDARKPKIIEKNGYKIGFLGYSMIVPALSAATEKTAGTNTSSKSYTAQIDSDIKKLKKEVDLVVATFHWGIEGQYYPAGYQKDIAHKAIDAGADIIIGHHPHRIQGVEVYKKGVIAYSLGNFMFTGASSQVETFIIQVLYDENQKRTIRIIPGWVLNGRPKPSTDKNLFNKIINISKGFGTKFGIEENYLQVLN